MPDNLFYDQDTAMRYYFDHAAAARPDDETLEFYLAEMKRHFANQEALHDLAYQARMRLTEAAGELLEALLPDSAGLGVIWSDSATSCFRLLANYLAGCKTISGKLEHPALTANFKKQTLLTELTAGRDGQLVLPPELPKAEAAVFHHVQSETGAIQDLDRLFAAFPRALHITDAVQSAAKLPLNRSADIQIISGIKFGAPGGAAILYRKKAPLMDKFPVFAAAFRTRDHALSRVSVPLCSALAFAARRRSIKLADNLAKVKILAAHTISVMEANGFHPLLAPPAPSSPYICNFLLPGIQSAVIVRALSACGVRCASGSACASETGEPSRALLSMGLSCDEAFSALRISFDADQEIKDVDFMLSALLEALKNY